MAQQHDHVWHPFTPMGRWLEEPQLSITAGEGNYLIDDKGNRYLDGVASLWVNIHGHAHPVISEAIQAQAGKIAHSTMLGLSNPLARELASRLAKLTGLDRVFYSDSGSTSVEVALKMAFEYWQRRGKPSKTRYLHLSESYHGDTLGALSVGGISVFRDRYAEILRNNHRSVPSPAVVGSAESLAFLERTLEQSAGEMAALIMEPLVQGAAGILVHPPGYLAAVRALCNQYDVLLILDEVAVGFGRTGTMFAFEREQAKPDLLCLAKGITGGYLPLAATLATEAVFDAFRSDDPFFHGHSYTGNQLACAAALASLDVFSVDHTLDSLSAKIHALERLLRTLDARADVRTVRNRGLMAGVELEATSALRGHKVCMAIRKYGVILRPLGNVIVILPPLSITCNDIETIGHALTRALDEVAA